MSQPVSSVRFMEPNVLRIDCDDCLHQNTSTCEDCLVTFLCERETDGAVIIPLAKVRSVRLLQDAGLAPENRHRRHFAS